MHNFMCAASRAIAAGCFSSEEHLYRNQARDPSTVVLCIIAMNERMN